MLLSQDYGKHLLGVEDLLQKHALVEADISVQADRVRNVNRNAQKFADDMEGETYYFSNSTLVVPSKKEMDDRDYNISCSPPSSGYKPCDPQIIRDRVAHMDFCYQELSQLAAERRARLEESRRLWKFFWEMAEEVFIISPILIIKINKNVFFIIWKTLRNCLFIFAARLFVLCLNAVPSASALRRRAGSGRRSRSCPPRITGRI